MGNRPDYAAPEARLINVEIENTILSGEEIEATVPGYGTDYENEI